MALVAGSVSVSAAGVVSGSGAALRLYNKRVARAATVFPGGVLPTGAAGAKLKQGIALFANADAEWMVEEMTGFGEAKITAGTGALQRTPNPNNADTDTQGPTVDKLLPIV